MRKQSSYKPKSKQELFFRLQSILNENKHMPLDISIIDRFKSAFNRLNQNFEQGTGDETDILYLNGIIGLLKIIGANSNRLSVNEELELYITAEPVRKELACRMIKGGQVGYKDELETTMVIKSYNLILKNMHSMTNYTYDEFVNRLKQFQDKKGHIMISS